MASKSPDAFRTISEVSNWLDTKAHVLRFWESKFDDIAPLKRAGGRRYYRPADMRLIGGIKKLLHDDGLTIKGVQKLLADKGLDYVSDMSPALDYETVIAAPVETDEVEVDFTPDAPDMEYGSSNDLDVGVDQPFLFPEIEADEAADATPPEPPKVVQLRPTVTEIPRPMASPVAPAPKRPLSPVSHVYQLSLKDRKALVQTHKSAVLDLIDWAHARVAG